MQGCGGVDHAGLGWGWIMQGWGGVGHIGMGCGVVGWVI